MSPLLLVMSVLTQPAMATLGQTNCKQARREVKRESLLQALSGRLTYLGEEERM